MIHLLLFALFFVLFASRTLGFDLSLAPGLSVKNAFLYLIFLVLAIETAVVRARRLELVSVLAPFAVYVAYATFMWVVVLLILDYPGYSMRMSLFALKAGPIEDLLVLLIFFYGVTDTQRALWVLRGMVWLVIVGNVVTVIDALNIPDLGLIHERDDGRVGGPIGNSNEYGAFLALFLPAILATFWVEKGLMKWLAGIGAAVSVLAFLLALSRGAIVGILVGGVIGTYYLRSMIPPQTLFRSFLGALLLGVGALVAAFAAGYGDLVVERFGLFGRGGFDASSGRTHIWGMALEEMLDHPITFITGFGWFAYETSSPSGFATHNTYLNFLYNLGMIGLALFILIAANILVVARRALEGAGPTLGPWLMAFIFGFMGLLIALSFGEIHSAWLYVWAFVGISLRLAMPRMAIDSARADAAPVYAAVPRKVYAQLPNRHGRAQRANLGDSGQTRVAQPELRDRPRAPGLESGRQSGDEYLP